VGIEDGFLPSAPVGPGSASPESAPQGLALWWRAVRPRTLTLAFAPVLAGSALAYAEVGQLNALILICTLIGALAIQAGTNLHNDAADFLKGADLPLRQGPQRVSAMGWASPGQVRLAAGISFFLASLCGSVLVFFGGIPILLLGVASLIAGWAYSSGPWPIAYTPLGELFVIAFFGLGAVGGSFYLQTQDMSAAALIVGLALGLVAAGVLMVNNYRDMEPDRLAGRRTLAILAGPRAAKAFFALFMLAPAFLLLVPGGPKGGWLALLLLPLAARLVYRFQTEAKGLAFNRILGATSAFQLLLAVLIALGVLL
jgi:1,4-dihydroxy-2-naphthoate octaprenyltransferase